MADDNPGNGAEPDSNPVDAPLKYKTKADLDAAIEAYVLVHVQPRAPIHQTSIPRPFLQSNQGWSPMGPLRSKTLTVVLVATAVGAQRSRR